MAYASVYIVYLMILKLPKLTTEPPPYDTQSLLIIVISLKCLEADFELDVFFQSLTLITTPKTSVGHGVTFSVLLEK